MFVADLFQMLGLLIICLGLMPSKSLNQNWDIQDPNAEIPHLAENVVHEEELKDRARRTAAGNDSEATSSEAVHIENPSKV